MINILFETLGKVFMGGAALVIWCWCIFALALIASAMEVKKK